MFQVPESTRKRTEEEKAKKKCYELRGKGNKAFQDKNYELAVAAYTKVCTLLLHSVAVFTNEKKNL